VEHYSKLPTFIRLDLIKNCISQIIDLVIQTLHNINIRVVPIIGSIHRKLKRYTQIIKKLLNPKIKIKSKSKILSQQPKTSDKFLNTLFEVLNNGKILY